MTARLYKILPDQAYCLQPGCTWRETGTRAETLAEAHTRRFGHETHTLTSAKVIFTRQPARTAEQIAEEERPPPAVVAGRRHALEAALDGNG